MDPEEKQITVPVPANRVSEFYRWFADWRDGKQPVASSPSISIRPASVSAGGQDELLTSAVKWWKLLNPTERGIWNLWLEASPKLVSDREMVEKLGLKSPNSIRGHINKLTSKAEDAGFVAGWQSPINPVTGFRDYGIRDMNNPEYQHDPGLTADEYTELLRQARSEAEA